MHYLEAELFSSLGENNLLFNFIKNTAFDGVWYWDLEKPENEWMSPSFWTTLGHNPDEMPHSPSAWQNSIFEEDYLEARNRITALLESKSVNYEQTLRYRHKDGSTVWIQCKGVVVRNEMGIPLRIFGAHIKVTAMILKEMMNQNNTSSFEQIHEATPISLALNSNNTEIAKGSDELIQNFNNTSNVQEEITLEDGTKYPIEMVGFLFYDKDDRPKIGSYIEDVSERVQLTKKIQQRDELLGLLAQNTSDTLMIFNNKNEITYASPTFERITGKKLEKFPVNEMEAVDYVHPDDLETVMRSYKEAAENKEKELILEHHAIHATAGNIWLEDRANMEYDSNGNHVKTFVVSRDVTKKKNLEFALLEESKKRKEIAEQLVEEKEKSKEELYKDLHDGVNQLLFASRLHLENSGFAKDENVSNAIDYLSKAIIEIRKIAIESTSQFIIDSSFDEAITEYLVKLNVHSTIKFSVDNLIEERLNMDDSKKKHLFRICQELSQNALKHSNATQMSFRFRTENNELILIAKDNGHGLKENENPGIGMKNIIDRIYLMEGHVRFINFKNKGLAAYIRVKI